MPSQEDLEGRLGKSQGLIDRMTNFGQYSGPGMDLASQEGNQAVETSMMMGQGGSQANAIKNRMRKSAMGDIYGKYNAGLGNAAGLQQKNDQYVGTQMHENAQDSRQIKMGQAGSLMGLASNFMGGAQGMHEMGIGAKSLGQTLQGGLGGLLKKWGS